VIKTPPNRLKELADAKGISRRDLAVAIDVTEGRVGQLEKPETVIPTKHVPTLAALLEVEPAHLMGWDRQQVSTGEVA
jgi:transcriptional regulator with XRE-family HTH domain